MTPNDCRIMTGGWKAKKVSSLRRLFRTSGAVFNSPDMSTVCVRACVRVLEHRKTNRGLHGGCRAAAESMKNCITMLPCVNSI